MKPELFLYLETCNEREKLLNALEAILEVEYKEEIDWLYSTLRPIYTTEKYEPARIISQFPSLHTFTYHITSEGIVIDINSDALRQHICRTISADDIRNDVDPLITWNKLAFLATCPLRFGEIK